MFFRHADSFKRRCIGTELKFVWWPKHCYISHKLLWLEYAYMQTSVWPISGQNMFDYRWYNKSEFLIARLTGKV